MYSIPNSHELNRKLPLKEALAKVYVCTYIDLGIDLTCECASSAFFSNSLTIPFFHYELET